MSVLMRRENTLIIEPGSDISKIQIINFILLPNSKKHFEGPPLYKKQARILQKEQDAIPKPEPVLEVDQNMAGSMQPYNGAERITKQFESNYKPFSTSNNKQETNPENEYRQSLTVHDKTEFKQKMEEKINERDFMKEAQNANGTLDQINLIKMLQRIEMKIDVVAARVENVENTVRGLWIEILK
ncbi:Hypothetical_protein [Hexamita inflata]|uniref:Hypothetical_protein n=1 Tax=Hexamita inflata TaxID=28002 RepID=A0AA86TE08_9EUKA|nr:Hypothetical protein HINF_LOCUS2506 [Hexamita inflata]